MESKDIEKAASLGDAISRRRFMGAGALLASSATALPPLTARASGTIKPALLGGQPVKTTPFPGWPVEDSTDESAVTEVVRSGKWGRGGGTRVVKFEQSFAAMMNGSRCLATSSGTTALFTSLNALGVGPGDEVIVSPYTFVACVNVILMCHALPVFADTNPETFQLNTENLDERVNERTVAILPVHLGGGTFDVDALRVFVAKHRLAMVEDSCQSHLSEWKGHRTGSFGSAGCFSFQASKNLNSGEGGAILGSEEFIERCYTTHNNGRTRKQPGEDFTYRSRGLNMRMTEFQASLLVTQMSRLDAQSKKRTANAEYLTGMLGELGGLNPVKPHDGCTRNAYHLFMMRYDPAQFDGLSREAFLKAIQAEGIPASSGYAPLNKQEFLTAAFASRGFQAIYSKDRLANWQETNRLPGNDRVCDEAVWLTQNMLLGPRSDMDQIVEAVRKIKRHANELRNS